MLRLCLRAAGGVSEGSQHLTDTKLMASHAGGLLSRLQAPDLRAGVSNVPQIQG